MRGPSPSPSLLPLHNCSRLQTCAVKFGIEATVGYFMRIFSFLTLNCFVSLRVVGSCNSNQSGEAVFVAVLIVLLGHRRIPATRSPSSVLRGDGNAPATNPRVALFRTDSKLRRQSPSLFLEWTCWKSSIRPHRKSLAGVFFRPFTMVGLQAGEGECQVSRFQA